MSAVNLRERLKTFIAYKQISTQEFERRCGLGNGAVSKVGDSLRYRSVLKIKNTFPELNIHWLTSGEGEMLSSYSETSQPVNTTLQEESLARAEQMVQKALEIMDRATDIIDRATATNQALVEAYNRAYSLFESLKKNQEAHMTTNAENFTALSEKMNERMDELLEDNRKVVGETRSDILRECKTLELPSHLL